MLTAAASGLLLGQSVLPYTFTTAELEALKTKLMTAEQSINTSGKGQHTVLQISLSEIKTLLRMIDMTYLQGLSASGYLPTAPLTSSLTTPLHTQTSTVHTGGPSGQPPATYVCHKCGIPGHYVQDCPLGNRHSQNQGGVGGGGGGGNRNRGPPPANYVCHKCNKPGHWIQHCPLNAGGVGGGMGQHGMGQNNMLQQNRYQQQNKQIDYSKPPPANYICHRCHVSGHWIKNCPTNGDPNFDKHNNNNNNNNNNANNNNANSNNNNNPLTQNNLTMPTGANIGAGPATNTDNTGEPPAAKKRKGLNGAAIQ